MFMFAGPENLWDVLKYSIDCLELFWLIFYKEVLSGPVVCSVHT